VRAIFHYKKCGENLMGKGDKKSKKGKRFRHSYGKTRARKSGRRIVITKKVEEKPKPIEQKKPTKPEPEFVPPVPVVEPAVQEIAFKEPEVKEIKEEVPIPEIKEEPITEVPEVIPSPVVEQEKVEPPKTEKVAEEKPVQEAPKKRGRPKKKKEE
jgi:ribosomal small subunit protein bTHX